MRSLVDTGFISIVKGPKFGDLKPHNAPSGQKFSSYKLVEMLGKGKPHGHLSTNLQPKSSTAQLS